MPVKELVAAMDNGETPVPAEVKRVADGLVYRDFITVGLLLDKLLIKNPAKPGTPESKLKFVADNWIYVQESDVKLGRIQIFNNWSPYLVADPEKVWIGLEYFATEGDEMWRMPDKDFIKFAIAELDKIDVARPEDVRDPMTLVNPELLETWGEPEIEEEGCLSCPGIRIPIERKPNAKVKYHDLKGDAWVVECDGLLARCLQHEIDHLNGITLFEAASPRERIKALKLYEEARRMGAKPGDTEFEPKVR